MLDLMPRPDLVQLDDAGLATRLDRALLADDSAKKRWGWQYYLHLLKWGPRALVEDPYDYWYPIHIVSEIRDITAEIERRIKVRKNAQP